MTEQEQITNKNGSEVGLQPRKSAQNEVQGEKKKRRKKTLPVFVSEGGNK